MTLHFHPDNRTEQLMAVVEQIIHTAEREKGIFAFGAGIALEMEASYQRGDSMFTRNHSDVDIHPYEEDIAFWKEWFEKQEYLVSYTEGIKDHTKAFLVYSPDSKDFDDPEKGSYSVDIYGLYIDDDNNIHSRETGTDDPWNMRWTDAFMQVMWNGQPVWVMKHEVALRNKRETARAMGNPLREKDVHDHMLFGIKPE